MSTITDLRKLIGQKTRINDRLALLEQIVKLLPVNHIPVVENIEALRSYPVPSNSDGANAAVMVLGAAEAGDRGGDIFWFDRTEDADDDNAIYIQSDLTSIGRWIRIYDILNDEKLSQQTPHQIVILTPVSGQVAVFGEEVTFSGSVVKNGDADIDEIVLVLYEFVDLNDPTTTKTHVLQSILDIQDNEDIINFSTKFTVPNPYRWYRAEVIVKSMKPAKLNVSFISDQIQKPSITFVSPSVNGAGYEEGKKFTMEIRIDKGTHNVAKYNVIMQQMQGDLVEKEFLVATTGTPINLETVTIKSDITLPTRDKQYRFTVTTEDVRGPLSANIKTLTLNGIEPSLPIINILSPATTALPSGDRQNDDVQKSTLPYQVIVQVQDNQDDLSAYFVVQYQFDGAGAGEGNVIQERVLAQGSKPQGETLTFNVTPFGTTGWEAITVFVRDKRGNDTQKRLWTFNDAVIAPNPVTNLTISNEIGGLLLRWNRPADKDLEAILIYESAGTSIPSDPKEVLPNNRGSFFRSMAPGDSLNFWVRTRDTAGNLSSAVQIGGQAYQELSASHPPIGVLDAREIRFLGPFSSGSWQNSYSGTETLVRLEDRDFEGFLSYSMIDTFAPSGDAVLRRVWFKRAASKPAVASNLDPASSGWTRTPPAGGDRLWVTEQFVYGPDFVGPPQPNTSAVEECVFYGTLRSSAPNVVSIENTVDGPSGLTYVSGYDVRVYIKGEGETVFNNRTGDSSFYDSVLIGGTHYFLNLWFPLGDNDPYQIYLVGIKDGYRTKTTPVYTYKFESS